MIKTKTTTAPAPSATVHPLPLPIFRVTANGTVLVTPTGAEALRTAMRKHTYTGARFQAVEAAFAALSENDRWGITMFARHVAPRLVRRRDAERAAVTLAAMVVEAPVWRDSIVMPLVAA